MLFYKQNPLSHGWNPTKSKEGFDYKNIVQGVQI